MTLRPGGGPARLLLRYWRVVQTGDTVVLRKKDRSRKRLAELGYLQVLGDCCLTLTPAGREAAQVLEASTGTR